MTSLFLQARIGTPKSHISRLNQRGRAIAVAAVILVTLACASTPPDRVAYTSINAAVDAVQTALKVWNDTYYAPGVKVDPVTWNARRDQVNAAYVKFQATAQLAVTLAQDVTQKDNALKIISDAAGQILALIQALGVK